jgi:hypothetical protein
MEEDGFCKEIGRFPYAMEVKPLQLVTNYYTTAMPAAKSLAHYDANDDDEDHQGEIMNPRASLSLFALPLVKEFIIFPEMK